ncbi:MAG: hypothetical protein A3B74_01555 [Candidatus Kerfeldbacteria bacterium RIFCSPHIGHO2_02_FULL_42_14]|uniref:Glycosyltransferase RgtA/B/C/D-like domain-containing protein n=1 Tax=Candidatus Kerfeldbacteria bacterium RIFCSPHIGHO2_02_FULL_42_14 TaxID=1798540 RepID=A0A1G2ATR7_9BACT|nr:MAG: hypothetical protein A3B74_01555 [Candidatus Kerfeldbacteria bacterium RIFCSPHIGHO2_02_FULL_42_14]OGY82304.1 MAG: hypothetical protein A3E60_03755 [Candidatus Kerfeldbacteria bacterium RIFCSPHIGHO2_12_FULL_42_13]OGY84732.1 MAG: hypothetical protein A3I91_05555 [Candidatus Kerfeldbacteria bacterium RIFCSPLOWO2_02_FULL_42_19]OGY85963.1 MAG: hypothetical protein A3G01_03460 [Candidatus Kerfeldbacteria bacterium RIFCSPLOWO2_12_FULL_43_9]
MDLAENIKRKQEKIRNKVGMICAICLLIVMFATEIFSSIQENQTIDEGAHLVSGFSYLTTGIYALNREHPPLVKLLAALPLLKTKIIYQPSKNWDEGTQWSAAYEFLYHNTLPADFLLFLGRLPIMLMSLLLGILIFSWTQKIAGLTAGLFALTLYAFDPNIIAHARYITTDVPFGLAFTAAIFSFISWIKRPTQCKLILTGIIFGLAQVTKFSAILLWLFFAIFFLFSITLYKPKNEQRASLFRQGIMLFGVCFAGTLLAILITYNFALPLWKENILLPLLSNSTDPMIETNLTPVLTRLPIIHLYLDGLFAVLKHSFVGHAAYLFGEFSTQGWWYYFPVTLFVKTPFATILLIGILIIISLHAFQKKIHMYTNVHSQLRRSLLQKMQSLPTIISFEHLVLVTTPLLYLLASMINNINIGWRHIVPIYPFIFILLGTLMNVQLSRWTQLFKGIILTMLTIYIAMSLWTYPFYLSYFSEIIGGPSNGHTYLLDSNLDWGQDLKRLRDYMKDHDIPWIYLVYFGKGDAAHYVIDARTLPTLSQTQNRTEVTQRINGIVAISITRLLWEKENFQYLTMFKPIAHIGYSIYLFDLRNE